MKRAHRPVGSVAVWTSPDGSRRFYTRRYRRWLVVGFAWFLGGVALMGPAVEFGFYDTWQIGLPFVIVVLTAAALTSYGAVRSGVLAEPGWVTNRRMLWTNRVPAHQVARFEPPPDYGTTRRTGIRIVLRDGRVLSVIAFNKGRIDPDSVGVAECAELNTWLETQGATHVAPPLH